ncbi:MAG TPA: hypothetical protein VEH04_20840 [Verrucomicrobiae bacterium]|nr:hypothetical protein [Verrucomicrobiae bacterium]
MKLARLPHEPAALVDFYQETLEHIGALCERTWFDRLEVVAEGRAARLWHADGSLHEEELHFPAPDSVAPRDASRDVFPGCPLTFQLTESLRPQPLPLERIVLAGDSAPRPPDVGVAEKLFRAQHAGVTRWRLESPFVPAHHFSLLALVRCEIQAIDQHWSLHRVAASLSDGIRDDALAQSFPFFRPARAEGAIQWPAMDNAGLRTLLSAALAEEVAEDLNTIRVRQENHLRRELTRVDDYFVNYERELSERATRSRNENTKLKADERLAAARAEHQRRRADQVQRHEIRVLPHFDALLLVAEPAWRAAIALTRHAEAQSGPALFIPRARRWGPFGQ